MDEGDRSGGDDKLDRETESADSGTGDGDPVDDDPRVGDDPEGDDPEGNDLGGDDSVEKRSNDEGFDGDSLDDKASDGDDGNGVDEGVSGDGAASDRESDVRMGAESDASGGAETTRSRTETDRLPDASAEGFLHRFRHDREGPLMWIREMLSSVAIVLVIGLILFGVSGVWPPMVAVESGSMEPNMKVGDLVFVTEPGRLAPDAADNDIGVVTHETGETADYRTFGSYGSVVIYRPPGRTASPIIHRAMFHVEEGENWYDRADGRYHSAADCDALTNCPAPHDGYITLGDNNGEYDQASGLAAPVKADWVTGVARVRVPYLGYVRLIATGQAEPGDVLATTVAVRAGSVGVNEVSSEGVSDAKATVSGGDALAGAAS